MAMATKFFAFLLFALIAISMLQTMVEASSEYHLDRSARINVQGGAAGHSTTNHACSSARNAAGSACVFPLVSMVTKLYALATTTGRPNKEDQNALDLTTFNLLPADGSFHF
ncbi:Gibberellin-regulated protein 5 [Heracleum sosnowskyi]|uniref:Gibberellin-regulated protein 5 n=1 Tax=Heracleum sosnowskyi TaxID=360622 RepID=A0AAD8IEC0_9APIA|nr:Gibberellin-regulated protein 5 [Heracleum sosnowskyi]